MNENVCFAVVPVVPVLASADADVAGDAVAPLPLLLN